LLENHNTGQNGIIFPLPDLAFSVSLSETSPMDFFSPAAFLAQVRTPTLIDYFIQSNAAGQVIILLLAGASIFAWSIMLERYLDLSRLRKANKAFERSLAPVVILEEVDTALLDGQNSFYHYVFREAVEASHRYHLASDRLGIEKKLERIKFIENALHRSVAAAADKYERKLLALGTIIAIAPFLGLLGTVWGVMEAFGSVAALGTATLQALAPGVSGALLTTVAALIVAIPSVAGYNFTLSKVRVLTLELENFASSLADRLELE
jgi:biopolymer transport protein TolQ